MHEEWRPVVGYEGLYDVSNLGRVRSIDRFREEGCRKKCGYITRKGRVLKPVYNKSTGYYSVSLSDNASRIKSISVRRLVAGAFCEVPAGIERPCVNHKDENKTNNCADNLEWCTHAYNNAYNGKNQRCAKPVVCMDLRGNYVTEYPSARLAAQATKANYKNISACCRGTRPTTGGYKWRFK